MVQAKNPAEPSVRLLRVGEQVRHILSEILARGDVHDETLAKHMVSVTEVRMSPDLRHATVFVKPLLGKDEEVVIKALRTNTAYLQREVAHRVKMKYAAKLKFLADESFDEGTISTRSSARRRSRGTWRRMLGRRDRFPAFWPAPLPPFSLSEVEACPERLPWQAVEGAKGCGSRRGAEGAEKKRPIFNVAPPRRRPGPSLPVVDGALRRGGGGRCPAPPPVHGNWTPAFAGVGCLGAMPLCVLRASARTSISRNGLIPPRHQIGVDRDRHLSPDNQRIGSHPEVPPVDPRRRRDMHRLSPRHRGEVA